MKVFQNPTGNSIEDEQNSKRHARRVRVYLIIFALWIAFLVILATILTPILVLQHEDSEAEKAYRAEENDLANNFTTEFRDAVLNAISAVYGLQGYIMGEMKSLPDLNASKEKRVAGQYFDTFDRYAQLVQSSAASIAVFLTAPGGVTYQFYPEDYGTSLSNWDLLDEEEYGPVGNWSDPAVARQSPWYSIETGWLAITGPYNTSSLPFVEHCEGASCHNLATRRPPEHFGTDDTWWIDLRQPVYQATAQAEASTETFWGFAMAALNVDELLETNCFEETMDAHNMHYTVFTNTSSNDCIVIVSSWSGEYDCTVPFMRDFINAATVHDVLGDQLAWKVAVKSALRQNHLTSHVRHAIVLSSVFGTAFIFAIVVYIIILCTRVYDGAAHAPKLAPFAMLTVGPCRGEELWELASDQMVDVTDRLGRVLARQMVRHRAYQIQQVHPLTTSYVTRSVAAAVQMAFDAIEELQSSPIDEPLRRLLGDDCGLLLSYAVHWCNDAVVRLDPMEGGYRYEGPDMVYGGRMWVFAAPNVVTVSPTALPAAKRLPHVRYKVFDSVFLRGVTARQDLYVLSNPSNHKLCEAEAVAAEQVRRARQAQREMAEIRGSEGDPHKRRLTYSFNPNGYDSSDLDAGSFAGRPRYPAGGNGRDGNWDALTLSNSNSFSDHSTPSSALRSRAVVVARAGKREGAVANPTSIIVPPSTQEAPLPSCAAPTGGHVNPLLFPSQAQERRMVRRPNRGSATSTEASGSSPDSSSTASDDEAGAECAGNKLMETFVEGCAVAEEPHQEPLQPPTLTARLQQSIPYGMCVGPLPALPPIATTLRSTPGNPPAAPAAATVSVVVGAGTNAVAPAQTNAGVAPLPGMSSRRVLDTLYSGAPGAAATAAAAACGTPTTATTTNSSSITTIGTGQRHGEVSSPKPLVMVPPSTEVVAAGGHGMASKSSSATPSSDSGTHGRRGNGGPSSAYDNPLAHNLAAGPLSMPAGGGGGGLTSGGGGGKQMRASLEDGGFAGAASAPLVAMASFPGAGDPLADSRVSLDTFSSDLLFRPAITVQADHLLRTVFDRQAVALDVSYDSVRVLVYYFYSSYKILFRPLAAPERHNIYRRLMAAFGVPQQGILEHLAARCAIRFLQRHEETQTLLWDQQRRLQAHASSRSGVTTTTASTSDEAASRSSIN